MSIRIPEDWDELTDWIINNPFEVRDVIVNLQRSIAASNELLRRAQGEMQWMSGSPDFGPGGTAEHGFNNGVQPVLAEIDTYLATD
jgi:hypothetical protein